jgi:PAS domain S-box-containing protein
MSSKKGIPDQQELLYRLIISEERYQNFMNATTDAIYINNLSGLILDTNNAACEALGYTRKEILNTNIWKIEVAFPKEKINQIALKLANGPINLEGCHRRKDGTTFPVDVRLSTFNSMGEQLVLGIARDISEQKCADSTIKKLTCALEQIPLLVIITDKAGTIEYVNKKVVEQTGYYYYEIIGQNSRILQSGKTPIEIYKSMWEQLISGNQWHGELLNKNKNGDYYWASVTISQLRDENDRETTHYLAVMEAVTKKVTNKY